MSKDFQAVEYNECPVYPKTKVDIIFRNKQREYNVFAGAYCWKDQGNFEWDIIEWREAE